MDSTVKIEVNDNQPCETWSSSPLTKQEDPFSLLCDGHMQTSTPRPIVTWNHQAEAFQPRFQPPYNPNRTVFPNKNIKPRTSVFNPRGVPQPKPTPIHQAEIPESSNNQEDILP
ncbi:hypothetical protein ILUMI_09757 [Ignelater luminosus]|uniref:Uncharacterized protein n=1 Tax=Ignelater luminosus TaxID=2038154 RepID=A0A8K0D1R8_IGNLU|nr:hypothetical protein ILUMI_09757 [Ignelater luminosus]